jgi:hypothetical protein
VARNIALSLALIAFVALPARADDDIDAKTKEILKKVGTLYKDAKSLHADMAIDVTVEADGQDKREFKVKGTIDVKRPNMFALRTTVNKDAGLGPDVISDGKNLFIYAKRMKQYSEKKAPDKLPDVGRAMLGLGFQNTGMLFQNVLADDPADALFEGVTEAKHVGMEKVDGKEAHHMKFKQQGLDWELWVASEGEPFVLKAKNLAEGPNGKLSTVETYTKWKLNGEFEKDPFTFKAPDGAEKVDRIGGRDGGPR